MKIGVVYPQTEYPSDPNAVRDYAQTVEGLGFTHLLAYDHVLGADPQRPGGLNGPYTFRDPFHEVFTLFAYLAGVTQRMELVTGILILPQRQTALVAKQAATLDVLSAGRLRLGVGLGWNGVEYTALNENFHNRGKRIEEQIEVLRRLWSEPLVTFEGRWHKIEAAGINPLPVQRPIPLWFGGYVEAVLRRAARLGDGWMPGVRQAADAQPSLEIIRQEMETAGRDPSTFGIELRLHYRDGNPESWGATLEGWQAVGATHASINTMGCSFTHPEQHLAALRRFAEAIGIRANA